VKPKYTTKSTKVTDARILKIGNILCKGIQHHLSRATSTVVKWLYREWY